MAIAILGDPGPLVVSTDVDEALIHLLRDLNWLPTYLRITGEERGVELPAPVGASYNNPADMGEWGDRGFPAIMVATAKTQGVPKRHGDGTYEAQWMSVVSAVVRGTSAQSTRKRASLYEGAVRRALGHRNVVAGSDIVHRIAWQGVEVRPVTSISRTGRYLAAGMSTFLVTTDNAFRDSAAIPTPDPVGSPPPPYVVGAPVTEIDVTTGAKNKDGALVGAVTDRITTGG